MKDKKYFNQLAEKLEELFPKGEQCECGKRLPCRSKALAFNAYANIFHDDLKMKPDKIERILNIYKKHFITTDNIVTVRGLKTKETINTLIDIDAETINYAITKILDTDEYNDDAIRIQPKLDNIIKILKKDKYSRQAVLSNWDPAINQCFTQFQFLIRDNKINMMVHLRSSDIEHRLRGDIIFFAHKLNYVSKAMKVDVGKMYIYIASLHYYL